MKRPRSNERQTELWQCKVCKRKGGAALCTWCSCPKLHLKGGLLHPEGEDTVTYGREWDAETDPADFPLNTIPQSGDEGFTLHKAIPFDEDQRVEFKECSFLIHFPAFNSGFEQPQDYFVFGTSASRWRKSPRAPLPETCPGYNQSRCSLSPQTPLLSYVSNAMSRDARRDRERGDTTFHNLIRELAPSFPDGRWLAKRVPPFYEAILLENVVAMLNSPQSRDGVLYLGVEDNEGLVRGMPLTYRQRRCLLYLSSRVLLTIHPPLQKNDVVITFPQVYSDTAMKHPIPNHCVVRVAVKPAERSPPVPLYIHPRITRSRFDNRITWNPLIPAAPVRRLGSKVKLTLDQIRQHLVSTGACMEQYAPFLGA